MLGRSRRLAILVEGGFDPSTAKTAVGVLRYRPEQVAAVIDSTRAGRSAEDCCGTGGRIPVVESLEAAAERGADSLLIGVAPQGGALPAPWKATVRDAVGRGWDVLSGLHVFLSDDPDLASLASRTGARLLDVRRPPDSLPIAARRAARSDAVDAVPADFVAGAIEQQVCEAAGSAQVVVVEGQGSLLHPGYSGVTLGLLHGACAEALVLCHEAGREAIREPSGPDGGAVPIPSLREVSRLYEEAASWVHPARVTGVALNTRDLGEAEARAAVEGAAAECGLPATDPVRFGVDSLVDGLCERLARRRRAAHA